MPLYDLAALYIHALVAGQYVVLWWPAVLFLVFPPTNWITIAVLASIGYIKSLGILTVVSLVSTALSWLGISLLYLSVS
jgi:hypothetical protein